MGNSYNLRNLGTQKLTTNHVTDLQLFQYELTIVDHMEIANSDAQLFIIDGIISPQDFLFSYWWWIYSNIFFIYIIIELRWIVLSFAFFFKGQLILQFRLTLIFW